jgi:hypothetical protein
MIASLLAPDDLPITTAFMKLLPSLFWGLDGKD